MNTEDAFRRSPTWRLPPHCTATPTRPADGDSQKIPHCRDYRQLRLSVPNHLITLRPTPSHRVVCLQSGFPQEAYVRLVRENMSYDVNIPSDDFNDYLLPTNSTWYRPGQGHLQRVKTPSQATNHQDVTTIVAFCPFTHPWAGINILLLSIGQQFICIQHAFFCHKDNKWISRRQGPWDWSHHGFWIE